MSARLTLISGVGDVIIPVLLFYVWNWDLHYILLFIYIDLIAALFMAFLKEQKIKRVQENKSSVGLLGTFMFYFIYVCSGIALFELGIVQLYPDMSLSKSLWNFLWEVELGIPQIALLIPLLFLVNFQQYKLLFIRTQQYRVMPLKLIQITHKSQWLLFLASSVIFFSLSFVIQAPLDVFLIILLLTKLLSDFIILPKIEQKALHKLLNSPHVHT
jgi:hypothetical protein